MEQERTSFAAIYAAWFRGLGLENAKEAAPRACLAVSTSYEYANGNAVPSGVRVPAFAALFGCDRAYLARVVAADRRRIKKSTQRLARNSVRSLNQGKKIGNKDRHGKAVSHIRNATGKAIACL